MSKKFEFVEIKEIPLNKMFSGEGKDFTPWLTENIELLGNVIGIDLIDAIREVKIGDFSLDIQATESDTGRIVAIENQYQTTDHRHLGQLITYMAGIDAEVVVWIAEEFRNEHISAINYLNHISDKNISFFCIRPRIITIGESDPSLEFVIIAKPDDWDKKVKNDRESQTILDKEDFMRSLNIEGKKFFETLFEFATKKGLNTSWGKAGFALRVAADGKNVSILRGYPEKSYYGQIISTTFGFIEKYVKGGELIIADYKRGLPFFQSTGPNLKWNIKNISEEDEHKFYQVLIEVIDSIKKNGLREYNP